MDGGGGRGTRAPGGPAAYLDGRRRPSPGAKPVWSHGGTAALLLSWGGMFRVSVTIRVSFFTEALRSGYHGDVRPSRGLQSQRALSCARLSEPRRVWGIGRNSLCWEIPRGAPVGPRWAA